MDITSFILKEFPPLTLESKVSDVKSFFSSNEYSHFPIVKNNLLIGLISRTDILSIDEDDKEIGYFQYLFSLFLTEEINNVLDLIKVFASNEANLIPVVNSSKKYIGYFDLIDILHIYNETPFLNEEGVVLRLEKEITDFSFSQVCQIIESNSGKVLGIFISEKNATTVKIIIKFTSQDVNEIIQAFRRYEYTILSNHEEDYYLEDLKERSEYLQKYLNI
ncbi:CBS domain-containing protein [Lutibacter citreus]|uniref:CBS domain-containing protein n=1 Tax=Lutibacter citreus TaxID=2138210 RepID=UPI000DBE6E1D|nr:CBS domain-containing protein [Lutibacter citreus]